MRGSRAAARLAAVAAGLACLLAGLPVDDALGHEDAGDPALTAPLGNGCQTTLEAGRHAVTSVTGEATLKLEDGREVVLAGVLVPRATDAVDGAEVWQPAVAANTWLQAAALGRQVVLAAVGARDRYGRTPAQVLLVSEQGRADWLQALMLGAGHARAHTSAGNSSCLAGLLAAEAPAREARRGLWSHPGYGIRSAEAPEALLALRHTFQVVEGRVRRAARVKGRIYLNFGDNWREDFTASVAPALVRAHPAWSSSLERLAGRQVRARGWIVRRQGPMIEISTPDDLEVIEDDAAPQREPSRDHDAGRDGVRSRAPPIGHSL
ncbi:MAG: thermonuclease family protein [Hyphomicrobiaceae bacterium]